MAVATDESHRGQGLMKKVLNAAIEYLTSLNEPFCYIVPDTDELKGTYVRFGFKVVCDFTLDKFSKLSYDIFPVKSDEYNHLMEREQYYLSLETEEYKKDLSSKKVMFRLLNGDLIGVSSIDDLATKHIYVCQEV